MATKKTQLTLEGYKKLESELRDLIDNKREENKRQLAEARQQGDLSENADYDAARDAQAEIEHRIKEIEDILNNAEIIKEGTRSGNKVALGTTVVVRNIDSGKEGTYTIVGTVESDPFSGKISNTCPLGEAIIGKTVGDVVEVKSVKAYKVEIVKIEK